ncbi:hypothetical protein TcWFU_000235 [Taenia crassiceps]|uniref:Uncharacterized protein n=1 Tax=Taenia crassiceps TaxID=6207 RepID=A0ABR4Q8L3_9CEST
MCAVLRLGTNKTKLFKIKQENRVYFRATFCLLGEGWKQNLNRVSEKQAREQSIPLCECLCQEKLYRRCYDASKWSHYNYAIVKRSDGLVNYVEKTQQSGPM